MTFLQALLFGIIQGIAEYFPISSSAHLQLFIYFSNISISSEEALLFNTACHLGTLSATITVLYAEIRDILSDRKKFLIQFVIPLLPLAPILFFIKPLKSFFSHIELYCYFFWITSVILLIGEWCSQKKKYLYANKSASIHALCIGIMQGFAIFPGISRSGTTISTARVLGWDLRRAVKFSFILAIPTGIGAFLLELFKLYQAHSSGVALFSPLLAYKVFCATLASFLLGRGVLNWVLRKADETVSLIPFSCYCILLGILLWIHFYIK